MEGENNNNQNNNAQNTAGQNNNANNSNNSNSNGNNANTNIDYAKIQEMIDGRTAKTEDSILKNYFQKQGLSEAEMESAINAFKAQKANQANAQSKELSDANTKITKLESQARIQGIKLKAYDFVDELNVTNATMSYILQLADISNVMDKDGKINESSLKAALQKVIDDVPGFKKQDNGTVGVTVGADTNTNQNQNKNSWDFGFTGVRPKPKN